MPQYAQYATTVIGAHSVPDFFTEFGARIRAMLDRQ
jgi:hypothetical protein